MLASTKRPIVAVLILVSLLFSVAAAIESAPKAREPGGCPANAVLIRASISDSGIQPNERVEERLDLSANGRYVVFVSVADNLVVGDTNGRKDVFVFDRVFCTLRRVNVTTTGTQSNGTAYTPSISDDGQFVTFWGSGNSLIPYTDSDCSNPLACHSVYIVNLQTGEIRRLSDSPNGQVEGRSSSPSVNRDGSLVAFVSNANNLVAGDTTNYDIFVRNTQTNALERIPINGSFITRPAITPDGRYLAFATDADLTPGSSPTGWDVYRYDRQTGQFALVSDPPGSEPNNGNTGRRSDVDISADGRYIAFESDASNLISGIADLNGTYDVFVRDMLGSVSLVSISSAYGLGNKESIDPRISDDGRYVLFHSDATNLVPGNDGIDDNIYVHDRLTHSTTRVSRRADGSAVRGGFGAISPDGNRIVFDSWSAGVIPTDTNTFDDVYLSRWKMLPGPQSGTDQLIWGNFEDTVLNPVFGNYSWWQFSSNFGTPLCTQSLCDNSGGTALPYSGEYWTWFGGTDAAEYAYIFQGFRLLPGSATLRFYIWTGRLLNPNASLEVLVDGNTIWTANLASYQSGYTLVQLDMSAYADAAVHDLAFEAQLNAAAADQVTNINIDNVELIWNDTGLPPAALNMTLTFFSRPAAPNNALIDDLAVRVLDQYYTDVFNGTVTTDNYGRFTIPGLEIGTHQVYIKPLNGLAILETVDIAPGMNSVTFPLNRWGDATGDNRVDLYDFSALAGAFGTSTGQPRFSPAPDFNGDGMISLLDFSLLAGSFAQSGAPAPTPPLPPTPITPTPPGG